MDCKEYENEYLTATQIVAKTPCELSQLVVLSSNDTCDLRIYDGIDINGELKLRIRHPSERTQPFQFNPHIYFKRGIYLSFYQKVDGCFIQWRMRPHPNI